MITIHKMTENGRKGRKPIVQGPIPSMRSYAIDPITQEKRYVDLFLFDPSDKAHGFIRIDREAAKSIWEGFQ